MGDSSISMRMLGRIEAKILWPNTRMMTGAERAGRGPERGLRQEQILTAEIASISQGRSGGPMLKKWSVRCGGLGVLLLGLDSRDSSLYENTRSG